MALDNRNVKAINSRGTFLSPALTMVGFPPSEARVKPAVHDFFLLIDHLNLIG
jgi:hypothetical protein